MCLVEAVAVADGDPSSALEPGLVTPGHRGGEQSADIQLKK